MQCGISASHRFPILHFCYRCFPEIKVNQIVTTTISEDTRQFKWRMCFIKISLRVGICQHYCSQHIPKEHVDTRYPFPCDELEVIASRDKDRYKWEVCPRNLPL